MLCITRKIFVVYKQYISDNFSESGQVKEVKYKLNLHTARICLLNFNQFWKYNEKQ